MSIKQDLWNKVLEFTAKKQPVFTGLYQAASDCLLTCSGTCTARCNGGCDGSCENFCIGACRDLTQAVQLLVGNISNSGYLLIATI